ncbi:MAG: hypothetical protein HZC02_02020 [Candidatus Levybacteria bacterium]|nr:hypothetical protein [Candidatus Levybacteria bacterium]
MGERRRPGVLETIKDIFQTRESLERERRQREAAFEAIGGMDAVSRMPLHEIEEQLGYDELPFVDECGNMSPSLAQLRREREQRQARIERSQMPSASRVLFDRIQHHFVQKARRASQ